MLHPDSTTLPFSFMEALQLRLEDWQAIREAEEFLHTSPSLQEKFFQLETVFYSSDGNKMKEPHWASNLDESSRGKLYLLLITHGESFAANALKNRNFPPEPLQESLADCRIWSEHHEENYGCPGLTWRLLHWLRQTLCGDVLRFGRLQCNAEHAFTEDLPGLPKNTPMINIHIPADGPLTPEKIRQSLKRMEQFFAQYQPDYHWKGFCCYSWLLDPAFPDLLGADSNIVKFIRMGEFFPVAGESEAIFRVFGVKGEEEGFETVPHNTSMRRILAEFLRKGGKFRNGGWLIRRELLEQ